MGAGNDFEKIVNNVVLSFRFVKGKHIFCMSHRPWAGRVFRRWDGVLWVFFFENASRMSEGRRLTSKNQKIK